PGRRPERRPAAEHQRRRRRDRRVRMAFAYPISLEVSGRKAVVIGRDAVIHGKADALREAGADVTVIADGPEGLLTGLERDGGVTVFRRRYRAGDLDGAFLCVASSDDPAE